MNKEFALMVVDKCEYAVMSMIDNDNMPYCIPLTIARENNSIYFHSAKDGFKIECLNKSNDVCIACIGDTKRAEDKFTTEFESAIIRGQASEITDETEKIHALYIICQRHTPLNMDNFNISIERSLSRTAVWKVEISEITGKRKKYDNEGKEMKFGRMN